MADVATEDRPIALPGRTLAVAVSLLAHAVVFAVLFWKFGAQPSYSQPPVMNVQLAPLPKSRQTPEPATKSTKPHLARTPSRTDVPPLLVPSPVETRAPDVTAQPSDGVRNVLRRAAGCEPAALVGLSPAEREACLDRLAKGGAGPSGLNLDRRGDYAAAKNPAPYLTRRPRNGCKVTGAGDVAPSGDQGLKAGIGCAFSF